MDFQFGLFNPAYVVHGTDGVLLIEGNSYPFRVIDKTAGIDLGDEVQTQTVVPACAIRAQELIGQGLTFADLANEPSINFNGQWWIVLSYRLKPTPKGQKDGEVYLILEALPISNTAQFRDDGGFTAVMLVTTPLVTNIMDEDGFSAVLLVTTDLVATFTDDAGLSANIRIDADLGHVLFADDSSFTATIEVFTSLAALFADESAFAVALGIIDLPLVLAAEFMDDLGLTPAPILSVDLSASFTDDAGFAAVMALPPIDLSATFGTNTEVAATITYDKLTATYQGTLTTVGDDNGGLVTTQSGRNIGAANADRYVVVAAGVFQGVSGGGGNTFYSSGITNIKINGVAATFVHGQASGVVDAAIAYAKVPTGTACTIQITADGTTDHFTAAVYSVISGTGDMNVLDSATVDIKNMVAKAGGLVVGVVQDSNTISDTLTWSGLTQQINNDQGNGANATPYSAASKAITTGANLVVSITVSPNHAHSRAFVSFGV